jgi:hypothetical protein
MDGTLSNFIFWNYNSVADFGRTQGDPWVGFLDHGQILKSLHYDLSSEGSNFVLED